MNFSINILGKSILRLASVLSHPIVYNERPAGPPSPDPRRLMKAPSRATLSPKGERGDGILN
jgi:hypothetical protein